MGHPILFTAMITVLAYKLYLPSLTLKKFNKEEIKQKIIEELKGYNFPSDRAEEIAKSASEKIVKGKVSLSAISNVLKEVFQETKGGLKSFINKAPIKAKEIKEYVANAFSDYLSIREDLADKGTVAEKPDKRDEIIGKIVRVKKCEAELHGDNEYCVCEIIGKNVKIAGRTKRRHFSETLYLVLGEGKVVTRGEVVLPRKKS